MTDAQTPTAHACRNRVVFITSRFFMKSSIPNVLRRALLTAVLASSAPALPAADWLLASTSPRVLPGQRFEVVVIGDSAPGHWPARLPAQLELPAGGPRIALELVAIGPGEVPGQQRYFARWPMEVTGVATLALAGRASARLLLDAGNGAQLATATDGAASGGTAADAVATSAARASAQTAAVAPMAPVAELPVDAEPVEPSALGFHEPMYFLIGGKDPVSARFQFSFRYRIFDDHGVVAEKIPVASGLYFGFTQTSLWDLESESKPFRDSSFRPSLFYRWALDDPDRRGSLALHGGYEHESNGKEDMPSRSIDTLFLRAEARFRLDDKGTYLGIAPKLWTYLDREDNPDIARYRGYGELGLRLGRDDALMFSTLIRRGTSGKLGTQFDLSYPIRRSVFSGVGAFVHLQAYKGYGETLLEYDQDKETQYRLGVSLVR